MARSSRVESLSKLRILNRMWGRRDADADALCYFPGLCTREVKD